MAKVLAEYPGRNRKITLFVKATEPRTLQWKDEYKPNQPPESFPPLIGNYGEICISVPFAFAERLLRGEPYKYFLREPAAIAVLAEDPKTGARYQKTLEMVYPYLKKGEIQKDSNGVPIFFPKDELPLDADDAK